VIRMKILCFIIIGIAFLVFYQQNPMVCLIMIILILGGYIFIKFRKASLKQGLFGKYFKKNSPNTANNTEKILTYILLDKYFSTDVSNIESKNSISSKNEYIEEQKQKVLKLLKE